MWFIVVLLSFFFFLNFRFGLVILCEWFRVFFWKDFVAFVSVCCRSKYLMSMNFMDR